MNKPNFFLGNSVIVLASLVIFISALLIPANPNFEGFTLTNPQLIEKFPSSVSQSEVHEAGNKVGLTDFISALNSKNKITGMPAGSPGSCAVVDQIDPGGRGPDCENYINYMDTKSGMPRVDYALIVAGCDPGEWTNPDPDVGVFNDGTFCYYNWMECGPASMDACNAADSYFIIGDYVGGGGGGNNAPTWAQVITHPTIDEDASATTVDSDMTSSGDGQCTDADGDTLTFSVTSENTAEVDCAVSGNSLTVTPASNWFGTASCTIRCDDGNGGTADDVVSITVNAVNDAPVLSGIPDQTFDHNATMNDIIDLYSHHSDVDGSDADSTFAISTQSDPLLVSCSIDSLDDRYIDCTYLDMTGASDYSDITVSATDDNGLPVGVDLDIFRITLNNNEPTITTPSISPSSPTESDSLTSSSSTSDADGDTVTKIYDWRVGGTSLASLNLPFDTKPSSSTINDYTSYDNDFTNNGATWKNSSTCGLSGSGGCLDFDGSNDRLTRADDSDFDSLTALSVCAWVYPHSWGGGTASDFIFDKRHNSDPWNSVAFFFHQSGDKLRLDLGAIDGTNYVLDYDYASGDFPTGSWQFVCGTWDSTSTNMTLYYNGAKASSTGSTYGGTLLDANGAAVIGVLGDQFQHWFDGYMDNIQFYNRALSANQISSMYNSGTPNYNIIHFDETSLGETWTVNVTPSDAIEDGNDGASSGVTVGSSNNAPTSSDAEVTTNEDTEFTFSTSDFPFSDSDGDSINKIKITSLETAGDLELSNSDVTLNQEIAAGSIGSLTFDPAANANGANYSQFEFKVHDGTVYSSAAYTMSINVTAVNDAPTDISLSFIDSGGGINESQVSGTTVGTLSCTDPESDTCSFTELTGGNGHSQFDISGTSIVTTQVLNYESTSSYTFEVRANDGNGGTFDETITINVLNVDETPSCTADSYTNVNSGQSYTTASATVNGVLANDDTGGEGSIAGGDFTAAVNSAPSGASSFTLNTDGTFTYVSDATYTSATDSFTYTATDADGDTCTGTATLTLAKTISIALSNSLSNAFTFSASAANAEVATTGSFHVNLTANGTSANLSIKASGDLSDGGSNTIALSNFKYNRTGNSNKVSLTTSETNLTESSAGNLFQTFFDFFIDVPASQAAGSYTTNITFRGETLL